MEGLLDFLIENYRKQGDLNTVRHIEISKKTKAQQILYTVFLDWTFGYGYKPLNAIVTSIILILFFAIIYYPKGTLKPVPLAPSKPRERKSTIRITEIPIANDDEIPDTNETNHRIRQFHPQLIQFWQALLFSFGVFTKIGTGHLMATRVRALVIAEWIIGLIMMAGLLYSLANTNPLLRSLLDMFG